MEVFVYTAMVLLYLAVGMLMDAALNPNPTFLGKVCMAIFWLPMLLLMGLASLLNRLGFG